MSKSLKSCLLAAVGGNVTAGCKETLESSDSFTLPHYCTLYYSNIFEISVNKVERQNICRQFNKKFNQTSSCLILKKKKN